MVKIYKNRSREHKRVVKCAEKRRLLRKKLQQMDKVGNMGLCDA